MAVISTARRFEHRSLPGRGRSQDQRSFEPPEIAAFSLRVPSSLLSRRNLSRDLPQMGDEIQTVPA